MLERLIADEWYLAIIQGITVLCLLFVVGSWIEMLLRNRKNCRIVWRAPVTGATGHGHWHTREFCEDAVRGLRETEAGLHRPTRGHLIFKIQTSLFRF